MADVPAVVTYGKVTGRFVSFVADTTDPLAVPDQIPLDGTITLTPLTRLIKFPTAVPPVTAIAEILTCPVLLGDLYAPGMTAPGALGVVVIATNQPAGQPNLVQWRASFALTGTSVQPASVTFDVPTNGIVDLSTVIAVPPEPPAIIVVSNDDAVAAAASAAAAHTSELYAAESASDAATSATDSQTSAEAAAVYAEALANGKTFLYLGPTAPVPGGTPAGTVILRTAS